MLVQRQSFAFSRFCLRMTICIDEDKAQRLADTSIIQKGMTRVTGPKQVQSYGRWRVVPKCKERPSRQMFPRIKLGESYKIVVSIERHDNTERVDDL